MATQLESSRKFRDRVINFFSRSSRKSWGKREIQTKIKELWTELLEEELLKRKEN